MFRGRLKKFYSIFVGLFLAFVPLSITAPPAQAAVCGFQGVHVPGNIGGTGPLWAAGVYTHCGGGNIKIRIDYYYSHSYLCVTPGSTNLYADPALGALKNAYYVGRC